ncbi:MAG: DmsC/YnfH family molybdoenzyme membrane anchor subunit [Rubrivivax sp.]
MQPAWSVILLTTLVGAAQGLFLALYTVHSYALVGLLPPSSGDARFAVGGSAVALALLAAGLVASFFHLGRPERAWRAATMWRTSWLAREVIVLPAFMAAVALYGFLQFMAPAPVLHTTAAGLALDLALAVGALAVALALALFVCTGMIYACLPFLAEWRTPLTPLNYTLMGMASGFTLAAALAATEAAGADASRTAFLAGWALVLTLLALAGRAAALRRNAKLVPRSTLQTAIGIRHPQIRQRSMGFMGGSFNTREFFHGRGPGTLRWVRLVMLAGAFVLPALLLALVLATDGRTAAASVAASAADATAIAATPATAALLALAVAVQATGLLAERWFFFAQARHPQNLYYQAVS